MALKVKFSQTNKPLTIKSSAAATTLGSIADVDTSGAEQLQANSQVDATGTTLIYNEETGVFESRKVWEHDAENDKLILNGGDF